MTTPDDPSAGGGHPPSSERPPQWGAPTDPNWGRPAEPPAQGQFPGALAPYGAQPTYGAPPTYGYPAMAVPGPAHPSATTALILGVVSLVGAFMCVLPLLVSPFAWAVGARTVREMDENPGRWSGRDSANAGRIMGMVGTVLLTLGLLSLIALVVVTFAIESS